MIIMTMMMMTNTMSSIYNDEPIQLGNNLAKSHHQARTIINTDESDDNMIMLIQLR